jgi:RNA polymerase-interacting CarD/CdnL/TRCF family regulator
MSEGNQSYDIGQWVVHSQYGVGQIKQIEKMPLHGDIKTKQKCFQVQTQNGIFWFPVEQKNNPRLRPITTQEKLTRSLKVLQEPPEDTDAHHNILKGRINEAQKDGSLKTSIELVRDLSARNTIKKLNILEERALKLHTERLIREWSLCMDLDEIEIRTRFDKLIQEIEIEKTIT